MAYAIETTGLTKRFIQRRRLRQIVLHPLQRKTIAAQNIRKLIREKLVKEQGKTVFLTTHNLEEAEDICDHLDIIEAGRIVCQGTPSQIRKSVTKEDRYILKVRYLNLFSVIQDFAS